MDPLATLHCSHWHEALGKDVFQLLSSRIPTPSLLSLVGSKHTKYEVFTPNIHEVGQVYPFPLTNPQNDIKKV